MAQAFACCKEGAYGASKAVPLARAHTGSDAKEKARVEKAGGAVKDGAVCGLRATRSFGDAAAKASAGDGVVIGTPDVTSFEVTAAQRFVVLGSEGAWRQGYKGGDIYNLTEPQECKKPQGLMGLLRKMQKA